MLSPLNLNIFAESKGSWMEALGMSFVKNLQRRCVLLIEEQRTSVGCSHSDLKTVEEFSTFQTSKVLLIDNQEGLGHISISLN